MARLTRVGFVTEGRNRVSQEKEATQGHAVGRLCPLALPPAPAHTVAPGLLYRFEH